MKTVFIANGVVVSHGTSYDPSVTIASTIPGATPRQVDDNDPVDIGWTATTTNGVTTFAAPAPKMRTALSPIEFKLQFTSAERLGINAARAYGGTDTTALQVKTVLDDWYGILDDPRLQTVDTSHADTIAGVNFLASVSLIASPRVAQILAGLQE